MKVRELFHLIHHLPFAKMKEQNLLYRKNDKADQLFNLIKAQKITNEQVALNRLFPTHQYPVKALYKTKQKLLSRIVNELLVLQHRSFPPYMKANFEAYKGLVSFKIAKLLGMRRLVAYIAENTLKKSIQYHVTEVNVSIARELLMHYAYLGNEKKRQEYEAIFKQQSHWLNIELQLSCLYSRLLVIIQSKKAYTPCDKEKIEQLIKDTHELPTIPSYQAILFNAYLQSICYEFLKQYVKAAQICKNALDQIDTLAFDSPRTGLVMLQMRMLPGLIINKQFKKADTIIDQMLAVYPSKNPNWIAMKSYQIFNAFHSQNYTKAWDITQEVHTEEASWKIYTAYATLLTARHLKAGKMFNELDQLSRDKMGMNINLIILRILHLLVIKDYSAIIDRTDSITQYIYRYLQGEGTLRSHLFFKLMLCLSKGDFDVTKIDPIAAPLLKELSQKPLSNYAQDFEVEVIPYEVLWEEIRVICATP